MASISRGTTPVATFTIPFQSADISVAYITFSQDDAIVLDKSTADANVTLADELITIHFTQEETLKFDSSITKCEFQIRVLSADGEAYASKIYKVRVEEILKDGVISNG